jgi:hypothetical protein
MSLPILGDIRCNRKLAIVYRRNPPSDHLSCPLTLPVIPVDVGPILWQGLRIQTSCSSSVFIVCVVLLPQEDGRRGGTDTQSFTYYHYQ